MADTHLFRLPLVAFDETGNTGQNLLDEAQPVFVLASVHMPDDRAKALASAATPSASSETKFGSLRTSKAGRKRILSLLRDGQATVDEVRIAVYHKSFMITTKVVDALVETWHHRMGVDFYENAAHLGLANLLHTAIPVVCGVDEFNEWQRRFVTMVQEKTATNIAEFFEQVERLRSTNVDPDFDIFLAMLGFTRSVVDEGIREGDRVALDPAIPTLVQLAAEWTAILGMPFDLVHDVSKPIAYGRDELRLLLSLSETARVFDPMGTPHAFPIQSPDVRFADSRDVPQLQLADLFAGAAGTLFRARARRAVDPFAEELLEAGIATLVTNAIWPDTAVSPQDLDAAGRPGSRELDHVVELIARNRKRQDE